MPGQGVIVTQAALQGTGGADRAAAAGGGGHVNHRRRDLTVSSSNWTFTDPASRDWWGGQWADRVRYSSFATQAITYDLSDEAELAAIEAGWRQWINEPDAMFVAPSVEIIARR